MMEVIHASRVNTSHVIVGSHGGKSRVLNTEVVHEHGPLQYHIVTEHTKYVVQENEDKWFQVEHLQAWSIPVVFDMEPTLTREEAARKLCDTLEAAQLTVDPEHEGIESWWLPEPEDKHIDGNDNDAMRLVDADEDYWPGHTHNLVERAGNEPFDEDC